VWGTPAELHGQRFWYKADQQTTNFINQIWRGNLNAYTDVATLALWRLGWHSDRRAEDLIHDRKLLDLMRGGYTIAESFDGGFIAVR
jgi:hypothetical protein